MAERDHRRVPIAGGTGTVGGPVVAELIGHGHEVLALARSNRSADALEERGGAEVVRGGLADLDVLRAGAARTEGVISLAFTPAYDSSEGLAAAIAGEGAAMAAPGRGAGRERPSDCRGLRHALAGGARLHQGGPAAA